MVFKFNKNDLYQSLSNSQKAKIGTTKDRLIVSLGYVSIVFLILFIFLSYIVHKYYTFTFDSGILVWIHQYSSSLLDGIIVHTTDFGSPRNLLITSILVGIFYLYKRQFLRASTFIGGGLSVATFVFLTKNIAERARPSLWDNQLVQEHGFSFVSGHAAMSLMFALALIIVLWESSYRRVMVLVGIVYVLYIGATRLYLGVHYPTDIIGGWIVGVLCMSLVMFLLRFIFGMIYQKKLDLDIDK